MDCFRLCIKGFFTGYFDVMLDNQVRTLPNIVRGYYYRYSRIIYRDDSEVVEVERADSSGRLRGLSN